MAVYLKNRNPTKAVPRMTPEEAWSGKKPSMGHLRPFRCKAYIHVPVQKRMKLDSKTIKCIFLGYCTETKGYRVFDPITRMVAISQDIIFDENSAYDMHSTEMNNNNNNNIV